MRKFPRLRALVNGVHTETYPKAPNETVAVAALDSIIWGSASINCIGPLLIRTKFDQFCREILVILSPISHRIDSDVTGWLVFISVADGPVYFSLPWGGSRM